MNKEQQELVDRAYVKYLTYLDDNQIFINSLDIDSFARTCTKDSEDVKMWGLKIEERKLTFEERWDISKKYGYRKGDAEMPSPDSIYLGLNERQEIEALWNDLVLDTNLPTKLITITYKNKKIESHE